MQQREDPHEERGPGAIRCFTKKKFTLKRGIANEAKQVELSQQGKRGELRRATIRAKGLNVIEKKTAKKGKKKKMSPRRGRAPQGKSKGGDLDILDRLKVKRAIISGERGISK